MGKVKSQEQFEKDVLERLGPDYKVLEPYPGAHGKVLLLHTLCGNEFKKNVHDIISKSSGCPYCNGSKPAKYNEDWVKDNTPLPYHYISGYKGMKEKSLFYCDNCETFFYQFPSRLINQHLYGCDCSPTKKKNHKQFIEELGQETLEEFEILEEYKTIDTPIKIRHKQCATEFSISPYNFIYKHKKKYCPICYYKKSQGEIQIVTFLEKHKIIYLREFSFKDLPKCRYDFYLPEYQMLIEYDGIQHFQPVDFFGGEKSFLETQKNDKNKNNFAIKNNLKLIRIPYDEFNNLNNILTQIFEEKSSTTIKKFLVKNEVEQ